VVSLICILCSWFKVHVGEAAYSARASTTAVSSSRRDKRHVPALARIGHLTQDIHVWVCGCTLRKASNTPYYC